MRSRISSRFAGSVMLFRYACSAGVSCRVELEPEGVETTPPEPRLVTEVAMPGRPASADPLSTPENRRTARVHGAGHHEPPWTCDIWPWRETSVAHEAHRALQY